MIRALALDVLGREGGVLAGCREMPLLDAAGAWGATSAAVWVDVAAPAAGEMDEVGRVFDISPLVRKDALHRTPRPKLDTFGGCMALAVYVPRLADEQGAEDGGVAPLEAVYLIFGERFLVTVHQAPTAILERIAARLHNDTALLARGMGGLVHHVIDELVDAYFPVLDAVAEWAEAVQQFAFVGGGRRGGGEMTGAESRAAMRRLFRLKRTLMAMRRVVAPQADALRVLAREPVAFYTEPAPVYFQDVFDHCVRIQQTIEIYYELLTGAREAFLTRVSNELAVATKTLLAFTCFLAVPMFVTALYGTNFAHLPELGWPVGHLWALALIAGLDGGLLVAARQRGWL